MNDGSATGLEPANSSRTIDAESGDPLFIGFRAALEAAEEILYEIHEYKAAREVGDVLARLEKTFPPRKGQRGSQGIHGEDQAQAAEIDPDASGSNILLG